jgi:hypothetical protein
VLSSCPAAAQPCKPNIVLILVDDQDPDLNTTHPAYMPKLNKWFVEGGVEIKQHRINTPICCKQLAAMQQQQQLRQRCAAAESSTSESTLIGRKQQCAAAMACWR